ncbi:MAG TPA: DNA adenine methylase [Polyangiaceae bacterium]|nr:DNA adenine methylase [Polyangiaceae bacterium]
MSADGRAKRAAEPRPVLKWAGGKSRSLPHILRELPEKIGTYYEPFMGGAAVFFALASQKRFKNAVLSDRNPALVNVYSAIKKDVESVIRALAEHRYDRDEYYRIRAIAPETLDPFQQAARLIYLNKTGYNGLYRVNSKGQFNVPFGRYKSPRICDEDALRAAARVLRGVRLHVADFENAAHEAERGDAVYFDPPYVPVSKTASFTAYHDSEFGRAGHERLAAAFDRLAKRGVAVVLSNSDTTLTRRLFSRWEPKQVPVTRPINSKGSARGTVYEILVAHRPRR